MKIAYVLPKNNAELSKVQDQAIRAATSARMKIQIALVATVHHLAMNHDVNMARRLVDGLQDTVRGKALVEFLAKYGCLTIGTVLVTGEDGKERKVVTFDGIKGNAQEHAVSIRALWDECKATMWWELKKENPFKGFSTNDALKLVISGINNAKKKLAEGKAKPEDVDLTVNDSLIQSIIALCKFDTIEQAANGEQAEVKAA